MKVLYENIIFDDYIIRSFSRVILKIKDEFWQIKLGKDIAAKLNKNVLDSLNI